MKTDLDMERIKEFQKLSWQGMFYSIQRIDLLIISICGAGIYVCLETLKFFIDKEMEFHLLIKLAGCFFLFGIIINFISQVFGYKTNEQDYLMCESQIDNDENPNDEKEKLITKYDKSSANFSFWTSKLNYASMGFMFLGLGSLMFYFIFIF